jgi:PKD repeat protein
MFDVTLTVSNVNGNSTLKRINYITVISPGGPISKFSGTPVNIGIGGQVQFTDESLGPPTSWLWTFEGGTPGTYDGQTPPPVTYQASGMFDVTLKVTNLLGTHTSSMQDYITVTNPSMPVATFSCDKTGVARGDSVLFTDESTGYPTAWSWTFEGGTPSHSSAKSPPWIVYTTPGKFDVTLVVTNENGSNTLIRGDFISVGGTGLEEEQSHTLLIYPNPAYSRIYIEAGWIIPEVRIMDVFGKHVAVNPFNKRSGEVDISALRPGVYFLHINNGPASLVRKIIVRQENE